MSVGPAQGFTPVNRRGGRGRRERGGSSATRPQRGTAAGVHPGPGKRTRRPSGRGPEVVHLVSECRRNPGLQLPARGASLYPITLYGINEPRPADRWRSLFEATCTGYRRWYLSEGDAARPDLRTCRRMLTEYMPELLPIWTRMVELADGDEP